MKRYKVKELAAIAGITSQTLRRYEELGIFAPERDEENQYRWYRLNDLILLLRLRSLRKYGFSLQESCALYESEVDPAIEAYEALAASLEEQERQLRRQREQAEAQRARLEFWKKLRDVPFSLMERPECKVFLYRDGGSMLEEAALEKKLPAVLSHMPPMRSCSIRPKEAFLAGTTEYRGGFFAFSGELDDPDALDALGCFTLPPCCCMVIAAGAVGRMNAKASEEDGRTMNEVRLEAMQRLVRENGFRLAGDVLGEVLHMCRQTQNSHVPPEENFYHYDIIWIPVEPAETHGPDERAPSFAEK